MTLRLRGRYQPAMVRASLVRPGVVSLALSLCVSAPIGAFGETRGQPPKDVGALELEARAVLRELLVVDTSHGNETAALKPVARRLKAARIPFQILESSRGRGNLVARLRGSGAKRPLLLIAHVDVVPVEGQAWETDPFRLTEKNGFLYGRGVGDDKGRAAALVATMLELARTRAHLSRDVILALTSGEETGGTAGAGWLLANHRPLIDAEVALNEGGSVILSSDAETVIGVGIGAAEKSYQSYRVTAHGKGGHSSVPPTDDDPTLALGRALVKLAEHRFPARAIPAVKESLGFYAAYEAPDLAEALRNIASSAPAVGEAEERKVRGDRLYNALIRTTCVTTMLSGSSQDNVLPTKAEATVNCRILPDETREATEATLAKVIDDTSVEIAPAQEEKSGPPSPVDGEASEAIRRVARTMFGDRVVVFHSMSTGASDSLHLRAAGIPAYGISAGPTSLEELRAGHGAHGPNERRPAKWMDRGVTYVRNIVRALAVE